MPTALAPPAAPDPNRDPLLEYVTEDLLRDLGIDPDAIGALAPHATELTGHGGVRCWPFVDLAHLLDSEGDQR